MKKDIFSKITCTLVQFPVSFGLIDENFDMIENRLSGLDDLNLTYPNIILLPELFSTGYDIEAIRSSAEVLEKNKHLKFLFRLARNKNSYVYTSLPEKDTQGKIFNTAVLITPEGQLLQKYRKMHLFVPLGETKIFSPGTEIVTSDLPFARIGLSICYDLRFAELYTKQRNKGVNFNFVCAEWPIKRINHWSTLLQARAIENQVFVFAVNRIGEDETGIYGGNSMAIAPDGTILANLLYEDTIKVVEVDSELIEVSKKLFNIQNEKQII